MSCFHQVLCILFVFAGIVHCNWLKKVEHKLHGVAEIAEQNAIKDLAKGEPQNIVVDTVKDAILKKLVHNILKRDTSKSKLNTST